MSSSSRKRARVVEEQLTSLRQQEIELQRLVNEHRRAVVERWRLVEVRWRQVDDLRGDLLQTKEIKEEIAAIKKQIEAIKEEIALMNAEIQAVGVKATKMEEEFADLRQANTSDDYFEKLKRLGAPSSLSKSDNWRTPQHSLLYLCHIPAQAEPPFPLTLAHPAFANFVDRFNTPRIEFGNEECKLVQELCDLVVHKYRNEKEMMGAFNKLLGKYLQQTIIPVVVLAYTIDGSLISDNHMVYLSEGKLYEGNSLFQAMHCYGLFLSTMEECRRESTFCPCFLVELVGFNIRISGLAFFRKVACQSFTPFMHCYFDSYDKTSMDSLCRAMLALKRGISELLQYDNPHSNPPPVDKTIPYSLWEKQVQCVKRIGTELLFLVKMGRSEELRLFKFCKRYGKEVHELWAAHNLAPKLFDCQRIAGGWFAVEMEYLSEHDWKSVYQWCNDVQSVDKIALKLAIQNALKTAQQLSVQLAHGDMRAPNIMAKSVEGTFEIKFVDFDWAGDVSSTFYPSFINTQEKWHEDVGPGKCLSQDHDTWWEDKWIQGGTTT